MRKIINNMGLRITEISEILDVSRPTMYKFIEMYESGDKSKIDHNVLKFLEYVERNPKMQKRDILYYALLIQGGRGRLDPQGGGVSKTVTMTMVERPERKLILLRSKNATDYMSYCEEMGCEWENVLNNINHRYDDAAILTLPKNMVVSGTSEIVSGIEVSMDFTGDVPRRYEVVDLPACMMLYARGSPYADEGDFCEAIEIVNDALNTYDPEVYGWKFDNSLAPSFNFGASAKRGARVAVPIGKQ